MRGEVLKTGSLAAPGLILGSDGKRYNFSAAQVRSGETVSVGQAVDFIGLGDEARDIYVVQGAAAAQSPPVQAAPPVSKPAPQQAAYVPSYMAASGQANDSGELSLWGYFVRGLTRHYVKFEGRGRRKEYWGYTLFWWIFLIAAAVVDAIISGILMASSGEEMFLPLFTGLFWLGTFLPNIAIVVRRLHDNGLSGWLILIRAADMIIPFAGTLVIFVITLMDSNRLPNKHGVSPKYGPGEQVADTFV